MQIDDYRYSNSQLNQMGCMLQKFYAELVKENSQEFKPESLKVMIASLNTDIKEQCNYSILIDKDFELSRKGLNGKAIQLQQSGKGKKLRKADPLTSDEEDACVMGNSACCN